MNSLLAITITTLLDEWIARQTAKGNPPTNEQIEAKKQWLIRVLGK